MDRFCILSPFAKHLHTLVSQFKSSVVNGLRQSKTTKSKKLGFPEWSMP